MELTDTLEVFGVFVVPPEEAKEATDQRLPSIRLKVDPNDK